MFQILTDNTVVFESDFIHDALNVAQNLIVHYQQPCKMLDTSDGLIFEQAELEGIFPEALLDLPW
jgi:hypothetical protein